MIRITKREKKILENSGCRCFDPAEGFRDICITYSHHKSYYLRETAKNIELLNKIRGID